jgi:dsRNA-specific ribonuclease
MSSSDTPESMAEKAAEYLNLYLPPRDEAKLVIVEGRNYTVDSLVEMIPASRADEITERLVKLYSRPFLVVETNAGTGSNTISLLSNKRVGLVFAYEENTDKALMLKRNITAYNLGHKAVVISTAFNISVNNFKKMKGLALHFSPSWLPSDVSPREGKADPEQYILGGITVGSKAIEAWLADYRGTAFAFVAYLPPKYVLGSVSGWDIKNEELKTEDGTVKALLYYGTCAETASYVTSNEGGLKAWKEMLTKKTEPLVSATFVDPDPKPKASELKLPFQKTIKPPPRPKRAPPPERVQGDRSTKLDEPSRAPAFNETKVKSKGGEAKMSVEWRNFTSSLPSPSQEPGSVKWVKEFQNFMRSILSATIKDEALLARLLDEKAMATWVEAFTHETYNAVTNYESLETKGDAILDYIFPKYIWNRIPDVTPHGITEYKREYMSKKYQSKIAHQMKFDEWVLLDVSETNINIAEDLMESFFGALDRICDRIKGGFGAVIAYNYMPLMFDGVHFDPISIRSEPKTQLFEYASRLKWTKLQDKGVYDETTRDGNTFRVRILLSKPAKDFMKDNKINIEDKGQGIAEARGASKKAAVDIAYKNALKVFDAAGLTYERVLAMSNALKFSQFDQDLVQRARVKALEEGFDQIGFFRPRGLAGVTSTTVVLRGVNSKTGLTKNLASTASDNELAGREKVLNDYLKL